MIDCVSIVDNVKNKLKLKINNLNNPILAIIQVGNNPASNNYVRGKLNDCKEVEIKGVLYKLPYETDSYEVKNLIRQLNADETVNGIIVQLPLPKHLPEESITELIAKEKDVDGFIYKTPFIPCTPSGVLTLLDKLQVNLIDKNITLVGYGKLVNPLMNLLSDKGANVTVLRSKTSCENLRKYCKQADVIVTAIGKNGIVNFNCINYLEPPVIIDCGIDVINGKQYGDCHISLYEDNRISDKITPRINGMGLLTRVALLENVIKAYELQKNKVKEKKDNVKSY